MILRFLDGSMSLRTDHAVTSDRIAIVPDGSIVKGDEIWEATYSTQYCKSGDKWFRVNEIDGNPSDGWIAIVHLGKVYTEIDDDKPVEQQPSSINITDIMRQAIAAGGCLASLVHDTQNPKWKYKPRKTGKQSTYPETITFSERVKDEKGKVINLTKCMDDYLLKINGFKAYNGLHDGKMGWFNTSKHPQAISFGGNTVIVLGLIGKGKNQFARVWAMPTSTTGITDTYFTPNGRLLIHKFTCINQRGGIVKPGAGMDAYIPFMCNATGEYYTPTYNLEMWQKLPMRLSNGIVIVEYLLLGNDIYGLSESGEKILLYTPKRGFVTSWKLKTIQPPA